MFCSKWPLPRLFPREGVCENGEFIERAGRVEVASMRVE